MGYEFNFTRAETRLNQDNFIVSMIIGLTCTRIDENGAKFSTYREDEIQFEQPKETLTVDEVRNLCMTLAIGRDWYNILPVQIDQLMNQPKIGGNFTV